MLPRLYQSLPQDLGLRGDLGQLRRRTAHLVGGNGTGGQAPVDRRLFRRPRRGIVRHRRLGPPMRLPRPHARRLRLVQCDLGSLLTCMLDPQQNIDVVQIHHGSVAIHSAQASVSTCISSVSKLGKRTIASSEGLSNTTHVPLCRSWA